MGKLSSEEQEIAAADEVRCAVLAYLSEYDNPVPDYSHRKHLRDHLRHLVGAPDEPKRS